MISILVGKKIPVRYTVELDAAAPYTTRVCKDRDSYDPKERYRPRARGSATTWLFDAHQCEEAINRSCQDKLPECDT